MRGVSWVRRRSLRRLGWVALVWSLYPNSPLHAEPCKDRRGSSCCATGEMWDERFSRCVLDARSRCVAGNADACVTAGDHYLERGSEPDRTQAKAYYRQACDRGAAAGCTALGDLELRQPDGRRGAEAWFARGCEGAHLRACTALAESLLVRDASAERERALTLLHRACDGLEQRACARLALVANGVADAEACALAKRARLANDGLGAFAWAKLEAESRCGQSDRNEVYRAFAVACGAGEAEGCFELAQRQLSGWAPAPQLDHVRDWLERACRADIAAACVTLADDFEQAKSGPQDPSLMRQALKDACALSNADACARLASSLDALAPAHVDDAYDAWNSACKLDSRHCYPFAEHLLDHPQSERDLPQAEKLLQAACDRQVAAGCALLADLRGWRAVQSPPGRGAQDFAGVQALLETACGYDDAGSCVKAALMLLNGDPQTLGHARELLEGGCRKNSQLACAYLKQGPYPFPYPSRAALPLRFAQRQQPALAEKPSTEPGTQPTVVLPAREDAAPAPPSTRTWLQGEFVFSAARAAKVGSLLWTGHAEFGGGYGITARIPMYLGVVRDTGDTRSSAGFGNPYLALDYVKPRERDRWAFQLGFTLPLAYVPRGGSELGLLAAADSGGLRDAFLWTPNTAGVAGSVGYQSWSGLMMLGVDMTAAALAPMYGRPNVEVFGAARGQVGLRTSRQWAGLLGLALRGLSDAEQARLALEPELLYAAESGGTFALGLSMVLWSAGKNAMGNSTWLGLDLRVTP